ncbi:acetylglutamate kinase [Olivibacter sitiensis]|uniref:acetylglutamate kinase n=1 Tax=Olivibacter sitiensis TaxID=376470 RepID=UPI000417E5F2|nr:acetylglutamate kinase [Olivibacter sitiensis]
MEKLNIIKIGGNIIDNPDALKKFLSNFHQLAGYKILVHGGGKIATQMAQDMGIEAIMVEGRRVTDEAMLKLVVMVYAGLTNKEIVAQLQGLGTDAIGMSGADANSISAIKRPIKKVDFGFVGDITDKSVNGKRITDLLSLGFCPVFCAITHDGKGQLFNTNADTIASALAVGLSSYFETVLTYCFEKKGVLMDIKDNNSFISEVNKENYPILKAKGIIADGMIPKLDNAFDALGNGVARIIIKHADDILDENVGTIIVNS